MNHPTWAIHLKSFTKLKRLRLYDWRKYDVIKRSLPCNSNNNKPAPLHLLWGIIQQTITTIITSVIHKMSNTNNIKLERIHQLWLPKN